MQNNKTKRKLKVAALLLAVCLPVGASAQGVFQRGSSDGRAAPQSGMLRDGEASLSVTNQNFGNTLGGDDITNHLFGNQIGTDDITNQTFGAPIGGGMFILLAAGAGYVTLKKRNKTNKTLKNSK